MPRATPARFGPAARIVPAVGVVALLVLTSCGSPTGSADGSASAEESSTSTSGRPGTTASGTRSASGDDDSTAIDVSSHDADDDRSADNSGGRRAVPQVVQPRTDLVDPRPISWGSWAKVGPSTVEVRFIGGRRECWGVSTTVHETNTTVEIGLSTGGVPDAQACPAVALESVTRVTLEEPLGDRRVVDPNAS